MDREEIRLRCIEAAARNPVPHPDGFAAGVVAAAREFEAFIFQTAGQSGQGSKTLGLPKK